MGDSGEGLIDAEARIPEVARVALKKFEILLLVMVILLFS